MITDKKILLSVLTLCILIFGLSMVSAADMNSTSQTQLTHINQSAPSVAQDTVTAQTHDNIKEVNKKTDKSEKSLKQSTITKEVNNYDELDKAVTEADNDNSNNYHIKLNNGSYTYNSTITWGNSTPKKLTINLNNQTLTYNGTSKINIFTITNGYSLNLENQGNTSLNIINRGNLTVISNTTFVDSYDKLKQVINNANNNTVTISLLKGSYKSNGLIKLQNQTCKNIIIRGNGQVINCTGYKFLDITSGFNVTISNTLFTGYTQHNGVILNNGTLTLNNISFTNIYGDYYDCYLRNYGNLTVNNSRIADTIVVHVIYSSSGSLKILNSNFMNNSVYDGILYLHNTTGFIFNSTFSSTNASLWGGVLYLNNSQINITASEFTDNNAAHYAGVIYSYNSKLTVNNVIFANNYAPIGGVIVALNSSVVNTPVINIGNSFFYNNTAAYEGGAIYNVYTNLNITSSDFVDNHARSGGVIYADCLKLNVNSSRFNNNHANNYGGALFVNQADININNTNFTVNNATYANDMYSQFNRSVTLNNNSWNDINPIMVNLTRQSVTPSIIIGNVSDVNVTDIPSKYDLRDYGWVSSVKNQGSDGNCWAFATMASLESCILKATNKSYDLSENNLKDIMATFSQYGYNDLPNEGGTISMAISYLVNWYGPVLESMDSYTVNSTISPLLDSMIHITNVYGIPSRANATDNNLVKEAIMKYGGVYAKIFMVSTSYPAWYTSINFFNHAVCIVGWDDNYSKTNFASTPEGDGAFIVKNSWGSSAGDEGYYYVSYYDRSILCDGEYIGGFTFILNDTTAYDNIYQYDYGGKTDRWYFYNNTSIPYSNEYIINDDETLRAFGTYVYNNETNYTLRVYIDDSLKYTQDGNFTHIGYETINFNKIIPVHSGDRVKIELTLHPMNQGYIAIPISESYYTRIVKTDKSLVNGGNWGTITVLKLYTTNGIDNNTTTMRVKILNNKINNTILNLRVWKGQDILDKGIITVMENNKTINQISMNNNVTAIKLFYNTTGWHNIVIYYNNTITNNISIGFYVNKINTNLTSDSIQDTEYNNTLTISGRLFDEYGNKLSNQEVWIYVNNIKYINFTDENGVYKLTYKTDTIGVNNVTISYSGNNIYAYTYNYTKFNVTKISTVIKTSNITGYLDNIVTVNATVTNSRGVPIGYGTVEVRLNNRTLGFVNVTGNGLVEYKLNLTKTDYVRGNYTVTFVYNETNISSGRAADTNLEVLPVNITIKASLSGNKVNSSALAVRVYDGYNLLDNGNLAVIENDTVIAYTVMNDTSTGVVLPYIGSGVHDLIIRYSTDNLVVDTHLVVSILKISTMLTVNNVSDVAYNRTVVISGVLSDEYGSKLNNQNISVSVNNQSYIVITNSTGGYTLSIKAQYVGLNTIQVVYNGSNVYNTTSIHTEFNTEKIITRLELDPVSSVLYNKNTVIAGRLYDADDNPLRNETISIQVNRNKYSIKTGSDGRFTFEFEGVLLGVNNVTVSYPGSSVFSQVTGNTSFNGLKHNSKITINQVNSTLIDNIINITGKLIDSTDNQTIDNADITITFNNNTTAVTTDTNGEYTLSVQVQPSANIIKITYNGSRLYNADENTITFKGLKRNTTTIIEPVNGIIGHNVSFIAHITDETNTPVNGGYVIFKVNGVTLKDADHNQIRVNVTNGTAVLTVNATWNNAINTTVCYSGSIKYEASRMENGIINISKQNTAVALMINENLKPVSDILFDDNILITGTLKDINDTLIDNTYVTITVNGVERNIKVLDGKYSLNIFVKVGVNNITVQYNGNNYYNPSNTTVTFIGLAHNTTLTVNHINDTLFDNNILITGTLKDINNTSIDNANVAITVNGVIYNTATADGVYMLNISAVPGANNIQILYTGSSKYNPVNTTTRFNGLKHDTKIVLDDTEDVLYDNMATVSGLLLDVNSTPVANAMININNMSVVTDVDGGFRINIKAVTGINNVTVSYNGNTWYNNISNSTVFTGLRHDTVITLGHMINDTKYGQTVEINGVLKDVNGTPVNNEAVLINDKEALTDDNGEFTADISVNVGINNITAVYNGNNKYNSSNATTAFNGLKHDTAITINEIPDTPYDNKINITGTLTDTDTQTDIADTELIININNITYTTTTDTLGKYFISNISVIPESNNITVTYNGNKTYKNTNSTITFTGLAHNTTLTVNPINNTAIGNNITVTGTLKDTNNTGIDNAIITITLNNQNYTTETINGEYTINLKTDTLNINNITLQYNGNSRYNPTNSKTTFNVSKTSSTITADNMTGYLGSDVLLNATIKDTNGNIIPDGTVIIKLNGKTSGYTNITNGKIAYKLYLDPDKYGKEGYNVTFTYTGNSTTLATRTDTRLNIIPFSPVINLTVSPADMGDTVVMTVKVTNGQDYNALSGNIRFKINGLTYKINKEPLKEQVNNGTAILKFYASKKFIGSNNITILYSGNGKFDQIKQDYTDILYINEYKQTIINTTPTIAKIGQNVVITAKFADKNGNPLTKGAIAIKINGKTFGHANITNGTATYIQYIDPNKFSAKNYTITIKFGGKGKYSPATVNTTLSLSKYTSAFTYTPVSVKKGTAARVIVKIRDGEVNANNGTVGLKINGKTYKLNGKAVTVKPVNGLAAFTVNTSNLKINNDITFTYSGYREFTGLKQTYNNGLIIQQ